MKKVILSTLLVVGLLIPMPTNVFAFSEEEVLFEETKINSEVNTEEEKYDITVCNPNELKEPNEELEYDTNELKEPNEELEYDTNELKEPNEELEYDTNEITLLRATDKDLWDEYYYNEGSVKKNITVRNYSYPYNAGDVNVYIENRGNTEINVNIYKGWWNSDTITYYTIKPNSSKVFKVSSRYGTQDCTGGNHCYGEHNFTVSVYSVEGPVSFHGRARVYY